MRVPLVLLSLTLLWLAGSGCDPNPSAQNSPPNGVVLDEYLYWEQGEEKVRAYLGALQAHRVSVEEESFPLDGIDDSDEEERGYQLEIWIDESQKFRGRPDSSLSVIGKKIASLVVEELNYVDYYQSCLLYFLWDAEDAEEDRIVQYSFTIEELSMQQLEWYPNEAEFYE